ncbi:MAG: glycogen synthase [Verrucomicrobia bacterium]|nr:MAG: glycogen synthase [Verrucomicrobiota bacterium]
MESNRTTSPRRRSDPRILLVTPEITSLPNGMGDMAQRLTAKAGGLADVSASLVSALFDLGADVHVALPHYRRLFRMESGNLISEEMRMYHRRLPNTRIHLAEDRIFYYRDAVYGGYRDELAKIALAFQREVINTIIPLVKPDLIHCNDWMTGLIPGEARRLGIPCLFTVHNIHSHDMTLAAIEDRGIDAAQFWPHLYFKRSPGSYEHARECVPVDFLASGIFGSTFINTVSPTFLSEVVDGKHDFVPGHIRNEIAQKCYAGCAAGILNAPDASYDPASDSHLAQNYTAETVIAGKRANKLALQQELGLELNPDAPLFFWPSRLDPIQKGCQLLAHILYDIIDVFRHEGVQVAIIANGDFQQPFHNIVRFHGLHGRVAVCDFRERLSRLAYAAADFTLMPSLFEPCGLPQMVSTAYGSLPIVHDTGGLHDTIQHLNLAGHSGNGFSFKHYGTNGLRWAIDEAMIFARLPLATRALHMQRIMRDARSRFDHTVMAKQYFDIYERMLQRPIVGLDEPEPSLFE